MKVLLNLAVLAWVASATSQTPDPVVTYSSPGQNAQAVLAELSRLTGADLQTSPQTAKDAIVIHVDGVPLSRVTQQIAKVLGAEWKEEGTTRRLVRSDALQQKQTRDDNAYLAEQIQRAIQRQLSGANRPWTDADSSKAAERAIQTEQSLMQGRFIGPGNVAPDSPGRRAIVRLLAEQDARLLAQIAPGKRRVFSTLATRMQFPLTGASAPILREFLTHQMKVLEAIKRRRETNADPNRQVVIRGVGIPQSGAGNPQRPGKSILAVSNEAGNLTARLSCYDRDGFLITSDELSIQVRESVAAELGAAATPAKDPALTLSPLASEFVQLLRPQGGSTGGSQVMVAISTTAEVTGPGGGPGNGPVGGGGEPIIAELAGDGSADRARPVSAELKAALLRPDVTDPVALSAGEGLVALAKARKISLFAHLDDRALVPLAQSLGQSPTLSKFSKAVENERTLRLESTEKELTVQPLLFSEARAMRINRVALAQLLRATNAAGFLKLDAVATYANAQSANLDSSGIDGTYLEVATPTSPSQIVQLSFGQYNFVKLWGTLTNAQRQALGAGNPVPIGQMNSRQISVINDELFKEPFGGGFSVSDTRSEVRGGPRRPTPPPTPDLYNEATEAFPTGVPREGALNINVRTEEGVLATSKVSGKSRLLTLSSLALQGSLEIAGDSGMRPIAARNPASDLYRAAEIYRYGMRILVSPQKTLSASLLDGNPLPNAKSGSLSDLPTSYQTKFNQYKERMKGTIRIGTDAPGRQIPPR